MSFMGGLGTCFASLSCPFLGMIGGDMSRCGIIAFWYPTYLNLDPSGKDGLPSLIETANSRRKEQIVDRY